MSDAVAALLGRTNELLTILVKIELQSVISTELAEPKKRELYELTGSTLPVTDLAKRLGMSTGAISRTWQKWNEIGLLVKHGGKYRRTFE